MLILSHRGYHLHVPENTLEAFQQAMALGVDGIETDIRISADGVLILYHDRLAPNGRAVSSMTHAELCAASGIPVPTLEAALELPVPNEKPFLWNLEVKSPATADAVVAIVERYRAARRILITSFCHPLVRDISRRVAVDCGVLIAHRPLDMHQRPDWLPDTPLLKTVVWYWETVDPALLAQSAACGLRNFVYGLTAPDEHRRAAEWGLDAIITDRPEYARFGR